MLNVSFVSYTVTCKRLMKDTVGYTAAVALTGAQDG